MLLFREAAKGALNAVIHLGATSRVTAFDEPYERLLRRATVLSKAAGTTHDDRIKKVEQNAVAANFTASDLPQEHIQMNFSLFVHDAYALRGEKEHEPTKIQVVQVLLGCVPMFASSIGATAAPPPSSSSYRRRDTTVAHRIFTRRFVGGAVDRAAEQQDRESVFFAKDSYRPLLAVKSTNQPSTTAPPTREASEGDGGVGVDAETVEEAAGAAAEEEEKGDDAELILFAP